MTIERAEPCAQSDFSRNFVSRSTSKKPIDSCTSGVPLFTSFGNVYVCISRDSFTNRGRARAHLR